MLWIGTPACFNASQRRTVARISSSGPSGASILGVSMGTPFSSIQLMISNHPTLPVFLQ